MNNENQGQVNKYFCNKIIIQEEEQEKLAQQDNNKLEQNQKSFKLIEFNDYFSGFHIKINNQDCISYQNETLISTKSQSKDSMRQISDDLIFDQREYQISSMTTRNEKPNRDIEDSQIFDLVGETNSSQIKNKNKKKQAEYLFINKYLNGQKLFSANTKFYIYTDIVIDIDYFKNYSQKETYINENKLQQIQKGFRFINQIFHRFDNKFIEVDLEFFPSKLNNIEQILFMLKSLGDSNLLIVISQLQQLWNTVQEFKILLFQESQDILFKKHYKDRQQFCEQKYQEIISKLDQNEMIFFYYHVPNFEKCLFESRKAGYSPQLYYILAQNSYFFMDFLQKNGCCDPRTQIHKLENVFIEINQCLQAIKLGLQPHRFQVVEQTELITCDSFIFPVKQIIDVYLLAHEYDKKHNLHFKSQYILSTYTFKFEDQKAYKNFLKFRQQQQEAFQYQYDSYQNFTQPDNDYKNFDNSQIELIDKYYADSIADLQQLGNKWFKRCGYADIPKKKQKKCNKIESNKSKQ
ncbi:hypothetical protein TTHERM_00582080 (macronuclear) [Tetrahymena thermophila SB210]|uniref:Uncharacterized protein n=1 Tax=Tetrahymena thermophila (strain SB210) TaxID=312017 RepID=Q23Q80_TETTS|nr:hypothetical protein TTHERM_00582080 [Tetrahymena thermophila SB210]EAR98704.1 hypothetical protein TTHERM_00582080 [Tetrahymena thermophila SB210]|eukprot:XP_001018949.1 hypothetical protein TTHERM_00582080 [Tetrahymena thermophila SB210]